LVATFDVFNVVVGDLAARLIWDQTAVHLTGLGAINLAQQYAQVGVAALGLAISFGLRRRAVRRGERRLELDLGRAASMAAPSEALQRLVDDPTARVLYLRPDATWVDAAGRVTMIDPDHRTATPVVAPDGTTQAVIETDARVGAHPSLIEIAAATIATRLANERVTALAKARLGEVAALQLALLDGTDAARRRLERDLHDGAQQRLVGVTLAARLVARDPEPGALDRVRSEVAQARTELVQLLDGIVPVVLSDGLAAALTTLAAMTPLDVAIDVRGDLDGDDLLARAMWFIACEAAANAVKHAGGSRLHIEFGVDAATASLRISDNGCGGVTAPPRAITQRVAEAGGTVAVRSQPQAGTALVVVLDRAREGKAA
jgi:signal transduction histidine kinase